MPNVPVGQVGSAVHDPWVFGCRRRPISSTSDALALHKRVSLEVRRLRVELARMTRDELQAPGSYLAHCGHS